MNSHIKKSGVGSSKAGVVGSLLSGLYTTARNNEKVHARSQSQTEMQEHVYIAVNKPQTVDESIVIKQRIEDQVLKRDTVILKLEKRAQEFRSKMEHWFNNF